MFHTTFGIGPSKVSPQTKEDIRSAIDSGILEISHRSKDFTEISKTAVEGMRTFFGIPDDYHIFYTASATHAMQHIIAGFVEKESFHFTYGNWAEVFEKVAKEHGKLTESDSVAWGEGNTYAGATIPIDTELIAITMNETSTGATASNADVAVVRKEHPDTLLAVDITSTAGTTKLNMNDADIWFFSVQKGMGLPAGLGVLIVSERAYQKSLQMIEAKTHRTGYLNLKRLEKKMASPTFQTINTPNVLGIYLLGKQLERWNSAGGVQPLEEITSAKAKILYDWVDSRDDLACFIKDPANRSNTVICVEAEPEIIQNIHATCKENGLIVGAGYSKLKETTLRIGNWPAITMQEVEELVGVLNK